MSTVETEVKISERSRVILHRYQEARDYGFTRLEARLYAESEIDCSALRRLVKAKVPPLWGARILL